MSQSDRRKSSSRFDWLNPSGEWAQEDYGARPAATSEPYDWTLKDGESRPTQVIPIVSPVRRRSIKLPKLPWLKRKAAVSETSSTIPLQKHATARMLSRRITGLMRPITTKPLVESEIGSVIPLVKSDKTEPLGKTDRIEGQRKSPGWALPLLLLAVIALFVFAYIAQK
jgi:hypothetical protein